MRWDKIEIKLENGERAIAQAPHIISASRSTDIPAFYADWFFHRLKIGYSAWINPFNGKKNYISYNNTRFVVFWSKNPKPLLPYITTLKEKKINFYIQYTLNDYEAEQLEAGVPPKQERIETFKQFSKILGKESVIWRFDPMILTDTITMDILLKKVEMLGDTLHHYTKKLVFSYADIASYKKVKSNLQKSKVQYIEWNKEQMEEFAYKISALNKHKGWNLQLATCAEELDASQYGIEHNRCIDGDLIVRIAWKDSQLMKFLGVKIEKLPQPNLFGEKEIPQNTIVLPNNHYFLSIHEKDKGQRKLCDCMVAKDIGEYNTCPHLCEYCYANANKQIAQKNYETHKRSPFSDTIQGKH